MEQDDVNERVAAILDGVQDSAATHARYLKEFTKLCEVAGPDKVLRKCLMPALQHILVVLKREPTVERLVSFLIQFASQSQFDIQGRPFPVRFMCELLPFTNAAKGNRDTEVTKAVRFRSTQLVAGVLNALSEETELKYVLVNPSTHLLRSHCPSLRCKPIFTTFQSPVLVSASLLKAPKAQISLQRTPD